MEAKSAAAAQLALFCACGMQWNGTAETVAAAALALTGSDAGKEQQLLLLLLLLVVCVVLCQSAMPGEAAQQMGDGA